MKEDELGGTYRREERSSYEVPVGKHGVNKPLLI
jgi:hypothetical protein